MYSLKDAWLKMHGCLPYIGWEGNVICDDTDASITFRANKTQGFISAYSFTLVLKGWLSIHYNGVEITLVPGDLYLYLPGLSVSIIASSEDYRGICLLVDERLSLDIGAERNLSGVVSDRLSNCVNPNCTSHWMRRPPFIELWGRFATTAPLRTNPKKES